MPTKKNPARMAIRNGAGDSVEVTDASMEPNNSTAAAPLHSKLLRIIQHEKPANVVVTIEGRAPIVVNSKKLKSEKRFRAVCLFRFGVEMVFDGVWETIVAEARRNGGAS